MRIDVAAGIERGDERRLARPAHSDHDPDRARPSFHRWRWAAVARWRGSAPAGCGLRLLDEQAGFARRLQFGKLPLALRGLGLLKLLTAGADRRSAIAC
jgi:hypothetical protein